MRNNLAIKKAGLITLASLLLLFSGCNKEDDSVVKIITTNQGGYFLLVEGKPFIVKGVAYNPAPIGRGFDYDLFIDPNKPWQVDGPLMKEMGVNVVRLYGYSDDLQAVKEFITNLYNQYGIYTIIGDWLGLWHSLCPNYGNPEFREQVKEKFLKVVQELKDTPGILMWVLGNENNYTCTGQVAFWTTPEIEKITDPREKIRKKAEIYYQFVDDIAAKIKQIDPTHPVALGNGEATLLDVAAKVCNNIDVLALIVYRGKKFGNFFENVRRIWDKPVLISEFGADSYDSYKDKPAEDWQAEFIVSQWKDIEKNTVFSGNSKGNCLGAVIFEWTDEWWKHNEGYAPDWEIHNKEAGWSNGSYYFDIRAPGNLNMSEEWFGIVAIDPQQENGINKRIPKKSYFALQKLWQKKFILPKDISFKDQ